MVICQSIKNKRRISKDEYNHLDEDQKHNFTFQCFDEDFSPGPGDDISISYRVHKAGLKVCVANFWVDHHRLTENFNDHIEFIKTKNAGYFRTKHKIVPSWEEYSMLGKPVLIDTRTRTMYGCFKENGELDDPDTMKYIIELTSSFNKDDTVLDIGANTGMMSLAVQHGLVYAFEPTIETFDVLKTNAIISNEITKFNKVIIPINRAVGSTNDGYVVRYAIIRRIREPNVLSTLNNLPWSGMNKVQLDSSSNLKMTKLDDELDRFKNVKLIKIDTEGMDLEVLIGATKLLDRDHPVIITEDINATEPVLVEKGYKVINKIGINSIWMK